MTSPEPAGPGQTLPVLVLLGSLLLSAAGILLVLFSLVDGPDALTWFGVAVCSVAMILKRLCMRKLRTRLDR